MKFSQTFKKPYSLFLITAMATLTMAVAACGTKSDIISHDTYLIFPTSHFYIFLTLLFLLLWLVYIKTQRILLSGNLMWFHVAITILTFVFCCTYSFWAHRFFPRHTNGPVSYQMLRNDELSAKRVVRPVAWIFLAAQLAFMVNILGGLMRRKQH